MDFKHNLELNMSTLKLLSRSRYGGSPQPYPPPRYDWTTIQHRLALLYALHYDVHIMMSGAIEALYIFNQYKY